MSDLVEVQRRVPPLVLIAGPEQVLAERGLAETVQSIQEHNPDVEVFRLQEKEELRDAVELGLDLEELSESLELDTEVIAARLEGLGLEAGAGSTLAFD